MSILVAKSKLWAWLAGVLTLVAIAFLVACGSTYNSSSDGLILVTSQGSALVETFSFSLGSGRAAAVSNSPNDTGNSTCVLQGIPSSIVVNPAGTYAYTILTSNAVCGGTTGIATFQVNSSGTLSAVGSVLSDPNPVALSMDTAGKFLFVAEGLNTAAINVYTIGSSGALTQVPGTFTIPPMLQQPNIVAVAPTPTVLPSNLFGQAQSVCSAPNNPPTAEYLYAADSNNNVVWEFSVDMSSGALGNPPGWGSAQFVPAGSTPAGVAVDPCDRYVYVTNTISNNIYGYSICTGVSVAQNCTVADGTLRSIIGSNGLPYTTLSAGAQGPGPLVVDPYGNFVYVLDTYSNTISSFRISSVTGSLQALSQPTTATGQGPTSIAIRSDDNWLFVTNLIAATVSQYSITPATGALGPQPAIQTDNYPWGVAVK